MATWVGVGGDRQFRGIGDEWPQIADDGETEIKESI